MATGNHSFSLFNIRKASNPHMRKKNHTSCWFGHCEIIRTVRTGKGRRVDEEQSDMFLLPTVLDVQKKNMNKTLCMFFSRIHLAGIIFQTFHGTYLGQWWCQEGLFVFDVYFFYNSSFALFSLPNRCYLFLLFQGSISHCKMWCFTLFLRAGKNKQRNFPHKLCVGERACDGVPAWILHGLVTLQRCCSLNFIFWWGCQRLLVSPPAMAYGSGTSTKKYRVVLSLISFHEHRALSSSYLLTIAVTFFLRACAPCSVSLKKTLQTWGEANELTQPALQCHTHGTLLN